MSITISITTNSGNLSPLEGSAQKPQGKLNGANSDGFVGTLHLTGADIGDGGGSPQQSAGAGASPEMSILKLLEETMLMSFLKKMLGGGGEGGGGDDMTPLLQNMMPQGGQQGPGGAQAPQGAEGAQGGEKPPMAKGEQDTSTKPTGNTGRPPGDNRSAEQIINDNPALKNLGNQKDIKREELKKQCGDWTADNKDPKSRADAAYNMSKVLNWIDSSKNREGGDRDGKVKNGLGDGNIEGITKSGDARHGTEAGNLKDFAEKGYGALKDDHQLDKTKDSHVKLNGSNKDNFQWFCGEVGKKLWFIPGLSNVLTGVGDSEGGFLGALKGAAGGVLKTWKGVAEGVMDCFKKGRVNPASLLFGAYTGALSETTAAPKPVKDIAGML